MKISAIKVRAVKVPMPEPHRTASGVISVSPLVLIDLATDEGITGQSMLFAYTEAALKPLAAMVEGLAPLVEGTVLAPQAATDGLLARLRLLGGQGLAAMAVAGIDMAMWDALARAQQMPLYRLLGAGPKPIKPYGAIGYDGEAGSAKAAERLAAQGFRGVKAKIGYPTAAEELGVVRAMRSAIGPDLALMVDYNQSLDPTEAARRLRLLEDEGLIWVEEPVAAHDFNGLGTLSKSSAIALQAGENWWGPAEFRLAAEAGATDCWMPDVMKCHGITGWMRVAGLAAAWNIPLSNHLWPELSAQMMCAAPTASWLEYCDWWNPVLVEPMRLDNGIAVLPETAGTGVSFDAAAVDRFAI